MPPTLRIYAWSLAFKPDNFLPSSVDRAMSIFSHKCLPFNSNINLSNFCLKCQSDRCVSFWLWCKMDLCLVCDSSVNQTYDYLFSQVSIRPISIFYTKNEKKSKNYLCLTFNLSTRYMFTFWLKCKSKLCLPCDSRLNRIFTYKLKRCLPFESSGNNVCLLTQA